MIVLRIGRIFRSFCLAAFFVVLSLVGYFAGRKERGSADDYFLAGRNLPWYVVGGSFIASNISTEHFIAMIGAAFVYGICVADSEWMNVFSFSLIIWLFIPFLMASKVFTMPEYLERRFNGTLRQFFAFVTVLGNVVAFLAGPCGLRLSCSGFVRGPGPSTAVSILWRGPISLRSS